MTEHAELEEESGWIEPRTMQVNTDDDWALPCLGSEAKRPHAESRTRRASGERFARSSVSLFPLLSSDRRAQPA
jgi:hypothetical protein